MIKYIGSKRTLVTQIAEIVTSIPGVESVCDIFTGTTRVAQALKSEGCTVTTNDLASYSEVLARCYIEGNQDHLSSGEVAEKLDYLSQLPGIDGYFTETFCRKSRFIQPKNGMRIDAIRAEIDRIAEAGSVEHAILLTSLLEAADRVDSTTGLQMAYLKKWSQRSFNDLELRMPEIPEGPSGTALRSDANELAAQSSGHAFDLVYIDPPYNQHSYRSNYHVWETLIRNDEPEAYGIACKRIDCRSIKSDFNSKRRAWQAFSDLVDNLQAPHLLVSFNNEGFLSRNEIEGLLREVRGEVATLPVQFKRYVGAQIGVHDLNGRRVGKVSHLENREYLFLAGEGAESVLLRLSE